MYLLHNEDQKRFVDQLRKMVDKKVRPRAAEIDEKEEFPWDLKKSFQNMGLLGIAVPEEYGGTRQGHIYTCLAVEEIAVACVAGGVLALFSLFVGVISFTSSRRALLWMIPTALLLVLPLLPFFFQPFIEFFS